MQKIACYSITLTATLLATISEAQSIPGGSNTEWDLVVQQPENPEYYTRVTTQVGFVPGSSHAIAPWAQFWCTEDVNEDVSLTAPWSLPFGITYYYKGQSYFYATADSEGVCTWSIVWEDSQPSGRNGIEKWKHKASGKNQQRRTKVLVPNGGSGTGVGNG